MVKKYVAESRVSRWLSAGVLVLSACGLGVSSLVTAGADRAPAASQGQQLLQKHCMGCHVPEQVEPLQLSRISHQRKTPEGWLMTIARMQVVHGLNISDEDRRTLVKHLADSQGLSPAESAPYRYVLERRLNHIEEKQPELAEMCARCHSEARIGLQRREQKEWEHLVHFHLGQWPSIEYSAMGRDRDWLGLALNEVVPYLGQHFGLQSDSWEQWQAKPSADVSGRWRMVGHMPGRGAFQGVMTATADGRDEFLLSLKGQFDNGEPLQGSGRTVLYSGYEWRADISLGEENFQQVLALDGDGNILSGRMFLKDQETQGLDVSAVREAAPQLMAVSPAYLRAGEEQLLSLRGNRLQGEVQFGEGIALLSEISRSADEIQVRVKASATANAKRVKVSVGELAYEPGITLYRRIGRVAVTPAYAVARVGEGGGTAPKVNAAFEAHAYAPGSDGVDGTADDLYIGVLPAHWSLAPFDAQAMEDNDLAFAGVIDPKTGVFTPGDAGPNPARKYGTNNAGHLSVIAKVAAGEQTLEAQAELIVTVQRWNNPPIR